MKWTNSLKDTTIVHSRKINNVNSPISTIEIQFIESSNKQKQQHKL